MYRVFRKYANFYGGDDGKSGLVIFSVHFGSDADFIICKCMMMMMIILLANIFIQNKMSYFYGELGTWDRFHAE
jgi:hypothetical protein